MDIEKLRTKEIYIVREYVSEKAKTYRVIKGALLKKKSKSVK